MSPWYGWLVRRDFCRCRIQNQDPHSWSTGSPLWLPALPFWNQLALVTQRTGWLFCCWNKLERTIMKTDLFTLQSSNFWIWVGAAVHVNNPCIQTGAENMMSQVFAPFLILNWECLGVRRRWKQASCFQAIPCGWRWKMHQQGWGGQRGFVRAKPCGSTCMKVWF